MKTRLLLVVVISSISVISIGNVLWAEYGMVCNNAVVQHLQKYSNLFDENTTKETYEILEIGYPFGVHSYNVKQCVGSVLEKRHLELEPVKIKVCRGEYIPEWCGEGANP